MAKTHISLPSFLVEKVFQPTLFFLETQDSAMFGSQGSFPCQSTEEFKQANRILLQEPGVTSSPWYYKAWLS
jgi:hypothetical protein